MKREAKSLANKSQADAVLKIADKQREKSKEFQMFDLSYFNDGNYFDGVGLKNYVVLYLLLKALRIQTSHSVS